MKLLPAIDDGVDQLAAAKGGFEDVRTLPFRSVATQTPADVHERFKIPFGSMLEEGPDHVDAPPAGLVEPRTEPLSSNATQAWLEAHARLKIPPPFGSTRDEPQAPAPPPGFVEVRIRPAPSLATHTLDDGHDWADSSTGFRPGAPGRGLLHVADAPLAAFNE